MVLGALTVDRIGQPGQVETEMTMTRYHPLLVALHWIMAVMVVVSLFFGKVLLSTMSNADPQKLQGLAGHMTVGLALGALLLLRLAVRFASANPPHAETGSPLLDKVGIATHWIMYLLIALMVLSGLGTALVGGLFPIVFGGNDEQLPANLSTLAPRLAHGLISNLLILFVLLHTCAALYHQFYLRDGLFRRMWFGSRGS